MDTTRRLVWATVIIVAIWIVAYYITENYSSTVATNQATSSITANTGTAEINFANASYNLEDMWTAMNTGSLQIYQVAYGSLVKIGEKDAAVTLIQNTNGGGISTYVAALFPGNHATSAVLLGNGVETETITIQDGLVIITYKERAQGQPSSIAPSVQKVAEYKVVNDQLQNQTSTAR